MLIIQEMPKQMSKYQVDLKHPNRTLICGAFCEYVEIRGQRRPYITYIPEETNNCNQCLIVAIPSQENMLEFLENSGLLKFADKNKIFIHLISACEGRWKTDGEDADYMNAVYVAIQSRDYYVTMQDNIYACGIGDGADIAQQAAKKMASEWSGLFTWGNLTVDIQKEDLKNAEELDQGDGELQIQALRSQLPVWMVISSQNICNESAITYWKKENHVLEDYLSGQWADYIWMQNPVRTRNEINEEQIAQVRVTESKETISYEAIEKIWNYIGKARRHRGRAKKNLRYFKNPIECGAVLQSIESDGMERIWYEYVPKSCTPDKEWPLVVVMHGRGGTAETFFDISGMSVVADEREFIAVFPQAGIHQQKKDGLKNISLWCGEYEDKPINDVTFICSMIADIQKRRKIDNSRIYACGQSSGGMMADVLCNSASDIFAACASWSALTSPSRMYMEFEKSLPAIPTMFIYGDRDFLSASKELDPDFPVSLDPEMKEQVIEKMQKYHLDKNKVQIWENKPITWFSFPNEDGVPMLTIGRVNNMVHANYPEESWISYDHFMCQFSRGKNGELFWRGKKVY